MTKQLRLLFTVIILLFSSNLFAKTGFSSYTGAILQRECAMALSVISGTFHPRNREDELTAAGDLKSCISFIVAVNDTLYMSEGIHAGVLANKNVFIPMPYCLPDDYDDAKGIKVILDYMEAKPKSLEVNGPVVIVDAFRKYYPCGR